MKKLLLFVLFITFVALLGVSCFAAGLDADIAAIINAQMTDGDKGIIYNKSIYGETLEGVEIEGLPAIRIYGGIIFSHYDAAPLEALGAEDVGASSDRAKLYCVFGETPMILMSYNKNGKIGVRNADASDVVYVKDLLALKATASIMGKERKIKNVYLWDAFSSHFGAAVIYITGDGDFIKYYPSETAEPVTMSYSDFQVYSKAFYEYKQAHNYDANGEPLYDGHDFITFVNEIYPSSEEPSNGYVWVIIVSAAVIAAIGVAVAVIVKKRKKA